MSLYYYDRYNATEESTYSNPDASWGDFRGGWDPSGIQGNTGYSFSESEGFTLSGSEIPLSSSNTPLYRSITSTVYKWQYANETEALRWSKECDVTSEYTQGTLDEANIVAEDGTYPSNGYDSGYWYVRRIQVDNGLLAVI